MPARKPDERLRGVSPTQRQRESRRALLVRERRELYVRELGLGVDENHAGLVKWWTRHLDYVRRKWKARSASARALAVLRDALPDAVSGRDRAKTVEALELLAKHLGDVTAPTRMRTAEDCWLADAQHELDDDELAQVLKPDDYRLDRTAAIRAVSERRGKIARRH